MSVLPLSSLMTKHMFTRMPDIEGVNRWVRSDVIVQRFSTPDKSNPGHSTTYVSITKLFDASPQATTIYLSTSKELHDAIKALGLDPLYVQKVQPMLAAYKTDQLPLETTDSTDSTTPNDDFEHLKTLTDPFDVQHTIEPVIDPTHTEPSKPQEGTLMQTGDPTGPDIVWMKQQPRTALEPKEIGEHVTEKYDHCATRRMEAEYNQFKHLFLAMLSDPEVVNLLRQKLGIEEETK